MGRQRMMAAVAATAVAVLGLAGCGERADDSAHATSGAVVVPAAATMADDPSGEPAPVDDVVVTHERVRKTIKIPFKTVHKKTATLKKGASKVARQGRSGLRVKVFQLTLEDDLEVGRELVIDRIKRRPVNRLVLHGTKVAQPAPPTGRCDPNYSGCVPIAYDVDCAGGSGDGPAYAHGPVRVTGSDIYDLDADGDGWACD